MRKFVAISAIALGLATLPVTAAHAGSTWVVSVKASATALNVGQKVTFTGTVRPSAAAAGEKVQLQEKFKPGKPWVTQRKATINGHGKYSVSDKPSVNTTHSYRLVMPATGKHSKGVSKTVKVTVYDWVNLTGLSAVNFHSMFFHDVDINGTTYKHSVSTNATRQTASIEFNLDHLCDKMRSTFGINDNSSTGGQAEVGVLSDGTSVYDKTFDLGQSETKTVALDKPLKIKLLATDMNTTGGTFGLGAFGTPQVHCTQ
jgi:hypothetical protein